MFGMRSRRKTVKTPIKTLSRRWKLVIESLEDRTVPSVAFLPGPLTAPSNRTDIALGNLNGFEEPNLTINNRVNPGNIVITSHNELVTSTNSFITDSRDNFPTSNRGDTWADFDSQGRLFWTNLDGAGGVRVVEVNPLTGASIGTGSLVGTLNAGESDDRQALAVDSFPNSPFRDNIYVIWTRFGTPTGPEVFVARSNDHNATWTNVTQLSLPADGFPQQVHIAVDDNGDVWASYHAQPNFNGFVPDGATGNIRVFRSTDGGQTWNQTATQPFTAGQADITFNRQENAAAGAIPGTRFLTQGSVQPYILPDPVRPNSVYVVAADDTDNNHGNGDDSDIYISRSTDNGLTWNRTLLPTGGGTNFQLFPSATIDQFGTIVVTWYENNAGTNAGGNFLLNWRGMYSVDGGVNWSTPFTINDTPFDPDETPTTPFQGGPTTRIGEYYGLDVFGNTAYVAFNGNTPGDNTTSQQVFFDAFAIAGTLTVNGDDTGATNDNFVIRRVAGNNNYFEVLVNGARQYYGLIEGINQINVNGLAGNDTLTIDHVNGVINMPINFDGGNPAFPTIAGDKLIVQGGSFNNLIYNATGIGAGNLNYDGNIVTFTNLEPVTVTSALGNVTVNLTDAAAHTSLIGDDGVAGDGLSKVTLDGGLESLTFTNPTGTLAFNGNNNNNIIISYNLDSAINTPRIDLNGGTSNDEILVRSLRAGQTVNIFGNNGTDHAVIGGSTMVNYNTGLGALSNVLGTVNALMNSNSFVHVDDSAFAGGRTYNSLHTPVVPTFGGAGVQITASGVSSVINVVNSAREVQLASGAGNDTFRINTTLVAGYGGFTQQTFFGNNGNDNFFVRPSTTAGIFVFGGLPQIGDPNVPPDGDRLVVYAYGATVAPLFSPDGVVTAPGLQSVVFNNIEFVTVPDRFEINDTPSQATFLGSDPFVTLRDLSIHSVDDPSTPAVNEADVDFFRYVAHDTGYLTINAQYLSIVGGQLVVEVYRPTSLANLAGPNVPAAPFNNLANYVTSVPAPVGTIDGTRLNIPVVKGQVYYIRVRGNNQQQDAGNYNLELENFKAPTPTVVDMATASDSGRSNTDNITNVTTPTFTIQADLLDFGNAGIPVLNAAQAGTGTNTGVAVAVLIHTNAGVPIVAGFADPVIGSGFTLFTFTAPVLPDGIHGITASVVVFDQNSPNGLAGEVKRIGRELVGSPPLYFEIDTVAPQPPSLFLNPLDDSGIPGQPGSYSDNITKYPQANFTGNAEAAAWVQFFAIDRNAVPQFGGTAYSNAFGQYFIDPTFELNNPTFFDIDGERNLFATATDVAGNQSVEQNLLIFLDTRGPQVAGVTYRYDDVNGNPVIVDLLNQTVDGVKLATPVITYLDVTLIDQPVRTNTFLYPAANEILATTPGNYALVGKRTGAATISNVIVLEDGTVPGDIGQTTYRLFLEKPLADDRYTFKIFDRIQDEAGNALDGDFQPPTLPSGDGVPGGNFVYQFLTIDARAELGFFANGSVNLDLNGDFKVNPGANVGDDAITAYTPNGSAVFAGQFFGPGQVAVDGFDRLGTYGKQGTRYVFRLDYNNDGDFTDADETIVQTALQINGLPIAGNWGPSVPNLATGLITGSNVGVFTGTTWYLDTNGNHIIENAAAGDTVLKGNMRGLPFTGDFDYDGLTDLGTYQSGVFYLDLTTREFGGFLTGNTNYTFRAALPLQLTGTASRLARPVAADFDADGISDIGLWIPNQTTVPAGQANWYLMNSNYTPWDIAVPSGTTRSFKNAATGNGFDIAATYGSARALPVVGNFDPIKKTTNTSGNVAAQSSQTAALAKQLADLYFDGSDSSDFTVRQQRRGRGR